MERRDLWRHVPLAFVVAMALTLASGLSPIFPLRQALAAGTSAQAATAALDAAPTHIAETGTMAGQAGTDGGAATYQVPIVVPPGRAGMQPSLSLNYNSRNGDGIAGMGWSISGLSSIHRCPQTPEQDGATRGVSYSSTDRLCLDGQRLVSVDGGYGNSGTVYRTEIDSYARVTQMSGNLASSTTWFKVEQKNGRILNYGNSANSRVQPAGAAAPLSWLVDKVQDRVGNFQSYSYTNFGNGEILLGTVTYTGLDTSLGTVAGNRSVEFSYQTRTAAAAGAQDIASSALAGGMTLQTRALESIRSKIDGAVVRKYVPAYEKARYSGRLLMTSLKECAGEFAPCHPPTLFSYNDGDLNFQLKSLAGLGLASPLPDSGENNELYQLRVAGDYDGDGTREAVVKVAAGPNSGAYLTQFTGDRRANISASITGAYGALGSPQVSEADMDGSGRAALIGLPQLDTSNVAFGLWNYQAYPRGAPASGNPFGKVRTDIALPGFAIGIHKQVLAADVDADGKTDVLTIAPESCGSDGFGNRNGVFLNRNVSNGQFVIGTEVHFEARRLLFCLPRILDSGSPGFAQADIDHIADFNGDGLPDFYLVYSGAGTLLTGGIAGIAITQAGAVSAKINSCSAIGLLDDGSDRDDCSPHKNYFHRWMDVNADGLEDFVIARPPVIRTEGTWRVRLNLGNGMFGPQIDTGSSAGLQVDATGIPAGPGLKFRYVGSLPSMDVDSDGRADLLIPSQQPGAQAFALKMCTIKRIHKIQTADGPKCPSASEQLVDPSGIYLAEGPVCAAYSCPPNPDGSAPMPANGEPLGDARGFPYQWPDENGNPLPAFSAYSSHPNHEGPGEDNSVYHLAQLKFVQTGPQQFTVDVIPTPMVSRLNDYYGSADDLFGDGLPDLLTSMGCSNLVLTQPPLPNSPPYTWQHQKCAVVNALGYGPATLPDGTPTANLASKVVLYANINQGLAAPGGSPGSIAVPHVQAPTLKASGSSLGLSLSVPHLPGLMDSVINGVGDFVSWGYFPLSVRAERDGVDLYRLPSDTASGYTDKRHYYFQSSMPVVYGMAQDRGDGGIDGFRSATYGYSEAMYHHLGRGFQGFREIVSTRLTPPDSESRKLRLRTTTTFHQKFPLTGRIEQVETQAPVPTAPNVFRRIKREFDTWICASDRSACPEGDDLPPPAVNPNGGTVYAPLLDRQVVETFDLDSVSGAAVSTVATVNAEAESGGASGWDGYGNLKHQYVLSTDSVVAEHRVITTNEYAPSDTSTNNWWLDRLRNSEVTTSQTYGAGHPLPLNVAQPPSRTVRTDFLWNDDRTPQSQTVTASGMTLTTAYDYTQTTAKGLPAKVTISGTGLTSARATQFTYTKDGNSLASQQDGYFVLTTKNAALHDSTTQHSPRDGQVTRQIDPNNLEVVNAYDAFGRLTGMSFKDANGDPMLPPVSIGYTPCTTRGCGNGYGEGGSHQAGAAWRVVRTQAGAPTTADWFDRLGRAIKHTERGFSETDFVESFTDYDPMGLVATQSGPFYRTEGNAGLTVWDYDVLGRPTEKRSPGEELDAAHGDVVTKYAYSGAKTTIQVRAAFNASQQTCTSSTNLCMDMSRSHDLLGRLAQTVQNNGDAANYATTDYWYDGLGNPIAARDAGGSVIKASYNSLGQRTDLFDLDAGHWSFTYDALGEVLDQTDGRNVTTTHAYDALGRLTQRDASNPSAADASLRAIRDKWEYDPPGGAGLLESSQRQTGTSASTLGTPIWKQSNLYDPASKRLSTQTTAIQGLPIWQTDYRYDGNGRLKTTTFPSSLEVENTYTAYGVLSGLRDSKSGAKYWEAISQDAWGNVTEEKFFGGSVTGAHSSYPSTGQSAHKVWSDAGGTLNRLDYQYDSFGNLNTQSSLLDGASHSESYLYDGLQRLKQATRSGVAGNPAPVSYAYKPNGNLANKTDYSTTAADAYSYGAGNCGPHAASAVARPNQPAHTFTCDANGNIVGGNTLRADYDFNNQPWKVDRIDSGTSASFAYSAEGQVFRSQSGGKTTWFGAGGYEETQSGTGTTQRHELGPVIVLRENGTDTFKAVLRDRLGSPVMLVAGSPAAGNSPRLSASPNPSLDGRYTISWTAMPGATRYELVESTNGSPESLVLNYLQQTWSPLTPKPVGRYTYRVRACTPACGDWSDPLVEYRAPNPPSTVSASAPTQSGSFTVSWSAAAGAESYTLEEKAPGAATFALLMSGITGTAQFVSGKPPGSYEYRVRACLGVSAPVCGDPSTATVTVVVGGGGDPEAPGAPHMNAPGPGSAAGHISLSWVPAAAPSPQPDYYVFYERVNDGDWLYTSTGLTSISLERGDGQYEYKVRACRNNPDHPIKPACSVYSNQISVTVAGSTLPDVPAWIHSSQTQCSTTNNATFTISWAQSSQATRYELRQRNADYDPEEVIYPTTGTEKTLTLNWPLHAGGTTFTYDVRACAGSDCSLYTATVYACFDRLNVINTPGSTAVATAYDAFGKVRNGDYSDRPGGALNLLPDTIHGFTGHQYVDDVRLIHMNGRVYDYQLGRFLSVDPVIQFPTNTQSLNPYSYVLNNPLSGTDPTGYQVDSERDPRSIGHGVTIGVTTVGGMAHGETLQVGNGADGGGDIRGPMSAPTFGGGADSIGQFTNRSIAIYQAAEGADSDSNSDDLDTVWLGGLRVTPEGMEPQEPGVTYNWTSAWYAQFMDAYGDRYATQAGYNFIAGFYYYHWVLIKSQFESDVPAVGFAGGGGAIVRAGALRGLSAGAASIEEVSIAAREANVAATTSRRASAAQREAALARAADANGVERCTYCDIPLERRAGQTNSVEIDHRKAYSRGGETVDGNLDAACRTCNRSKGAKELGTEWIAPKRRER